MWIFVAIIVLILISLISTIFGTSKELIHPDLDPEPDPKDFYWEDHDYSPGYSNAYSAWAKRREDWDEYMEEKK
jgi:hypothetical protein